MKLYCLNTVSGLKPLYDSDYSEKKRLKLNETYEVEIRVPRNFMHHKKFFALLRLVFENQEVYQNIEHLRKDLIMEAGYYTERPNMHGEIIMEPVSISFSSMEQAEFDELYTKCITAAANYLQIKNEDVLAAINDFL